MSKQLGLVCKWQLDLGWFSTHFISKIHIYQMDIISLLNDCSVKCYGNVKSKEGPFLFQKLIAKSIWLNLAFFINKLVLQTVQPAAEQWRCAPQQKRGSDIRHGNIQINCLKLIALLKITSSSPMKGQEKLCSKESVF